MKKSTWAKIWKEHQKILLFLPDDMIGDFLNPSLYIFYNFRNNE